MLKSLIAIVVFVAITNGQSTDLITTPGAFGDAVVDATVSRISQTCIFGDDKRFLRRLAYVETTDGTDTDEFNEGKNGGIWKIDAAMLSALDDSSLDNLKAAIKNEFGIDWAQVTYEDLEMPLHSALASTLYTQYITATTAVSDVPRSVADQAVFWSDYYRKGSPAETYETKAQFFEDSQASCKVGADIVFILDESGSIGSGDYQTEKEFVTKVIENLELGPTANQVGVITYGSYSDLDIKLDQFSDRDALIQAVDSLGYSGGGTATDLALAQLTDVAFAVGNGVRPIEQGHPRVGIVLTDGGSNNGAATQREATRAKEAEIMLFSIGVGQSVNVPELEGIASEPTCLYYSQLNGGFAEILDLVAAISATTCSVPVPIRSNGTLVKPVEPHVPYNCEITVSPEGTSIVLSTTAGTISFFLSETTYPSQAFYDAVYKVKSGSTSTVYLPSEEDKDKIIYCSILSENETEVVIITKPGPVTFNCDTERNPCTSANIAEEKYYFPHDDPSKYVQCGGVDICYTRNCPAGLVWDQDELTCVRSSNSEPGEGPDPGPNPPPSGYTCAAPNPCTTNDLTVTGFYFPHVDITKFIQCDAHDGCFEMSCGPGTRWNQDVKTCVHA